MESKYWIIAPYESDSNIFNEVWQYDQENKTIAIGFEILGNLKDRDFSYIKQIYPNIPTRNANTLLRFYNEIDLGDIIIARKGLKKVIGIGVVIGRAYFDEIKGKKRTQNQKDNYVNFIDVDWNPVDIELDVLLGQYTMDNAKLYQDLPKKLQNELVELNLFSYKGENSLSEILVNKQNLGTTYRNINPYFVKMEKEYWAERKHNIIQEKLFNKLVNEYGINKVIMEKNYVDIRVETSSKIILYEVKPYESVSLCIREALGQLLGYFWKEKASKQITLIIAGNVNPNQDEQDYINFLKKHFEQSFTFDYVVIQ